MSASLVGSEMCIRDRNHKRLSRRLKRLMLYSFFRALRRGKPSTRAGRCCLLYTSDAADDM
eukprot:14383480-Alexandrium_andersonii.AAC.1